VVAHGDAGRPFRSWEPFLHGAQSAVMAFTVSWPVATGV